MAEQLTFEDLLRIAPDLGEVVRYMPEDLRHRCTIRIFPPRTVIHHKDSPLQSFGIVCRGEHRVINEFENGNIFMIEKNEAISFIGEVTLLAEQKLTSVTIETLTECLVCFFSIPDFERWVARDIHFLRQLSRQVALKLYRSSQNRGARLFYSAGYLLLKYLLDAARPEAMERDGRFVLKKTRQQISEETGMTVKTLDRTIARLKEAGLISTEKGKMTMTEEQYGRARAKADIYVRQGRMGERA